jgi:hypothetical protein
VRVLILTGLALVAAAVSAAVAFANPIPGIEQQRIVAEFGRTYLPHFMPAGYIYVRWSAIEGSSGAAGEWPQVLFGDHGRRVQWTVEHAQDPQTESYQACTKHQPFATKVFHHAGRTLYYGAGAVGQDVTVCLPNNLGLVVWNDYSLSTATLVKIALSARAVG